MSMSLFTQSPMEGAIWAGAVTVQSKIASAITGTPLFLGFLSLAIGFGLIAYLYQSGRQGDLQRGLLRFCMVLVTVAAGYSFLTKQNSGPFSPVNANNTSWRDIRAVADNVRYRALQSESGGLFWYTQIHWAFLQASRFLTKTVNSAFGDPLEDSAPQYIFNALTATARLSIDDPTVERSLDELVTNCSKNAAGKVIGQTDSMRELFDLSQPRCRTRYADAQSALKQWARRMRPQTLSSQISAALPDSLRQLGFDRPEVIDNKIIGSALREYARHKAGEIYSFHNTNAQAMIGETDFWVNLNKIFSTDGLLTLGNGVRKLFGYETADLEGASARNEAAVMYNRLLSTLPVVRGYAKAILAYTWIAAAFALCLGITGTFFGWLKMAAFFSLYEPLSAALYGFTSKLLTTTETILAMNSLEADPFVLAGAQVVDYNLARVQLVYFCLQIALISIFGIAGIKAFAPIHSIRHSYFADLVRSATHTATTALRISHYVPSANRKTGV